MTDFKMREIPNESGKPDPAYEFQFIQTMDLDPTDFNKKDKMHESVLFKACSFGDVEALKKLIGLAAERNRYINPNTTNKFGMTPLIVACAYGHSEVVELLIKNWGRELLVNEIDMVDKSALVYACENEDKKVVELLTVLENLKLSMVYDEGETTLHILLKNESFELVKLILDLNVELPLNVLDSGNNTPLSLACEAKSVEMVTLLLEDIRVDPNFNCRNQQTVLHLLCGYLNKYFDEEIFKLFLDSERVDVNLQDADGHTPFMIACIYGNKEAAALLYNEERVDCTILNKEGLTAFTIAKINGHSKMLIEIVEEKMGF